MSFGGFTIALNATTWPSSGPVAPDGRPSLTLQPSKGPPLTRTVVSAPNRPSAASATTTPSHRRAPAHPASPDCCFHVARAAVVDAAASRNPNATATAPRSRAPRTPAATHAHAPHDTVTTIAGTFSPVVQNAFSATTTPAQAPAHTLAASGRPRLFVERPAITVTSSSRGLSRRRTSSDRSQARASGPLAP